MTDPARGEVVVADMSTETGSDASQTGLDPATGRRLQLASDAADILEALAKSGSWKKLDRCFAEHLRDRAVQLGEFLGKVREHSALDHGEEDRLTVRQIRAHVLDSERSFRCHLPYRRQ